LDQLRRLYEKTTENIRGQIAASLTTSLPPHKLEEFRNAFFHFDENKDGQLSRLELKSALSSLGIVEIDFEGNNKQFESYFKDLSKGTDQVQFEDFANFMSSRETIDRVNVGQLNDSFSSLANGRPFVTVDDLRKAALDQEAIEYITLNFEPMEGGFDYGKFLNNSFAQ